MHPKCKVANKDQSHEIVLMPFEAKGKPRSKSRKLVARGEIRWLLTSVRWGVLSACVFFTIHGFTLSYNKYNAKQTSVSTAKYEVEKHTYPSVTICQEFKDQKDIVLDILNEEILREYVEQGDNETVLFREFEKHSWKLIEILQEFAHAEEGNPVAGKQKLYDPQFWKRSVPHVRESGICHTYDPPFESMPGWWYGIRIGVKHVQSEGISVEQKVNKFMDLRIYLHEKDKFTFFNEGDYPDSFKLDMSWLRYGMASNIAVGYSASTALTRPERPCTGAPEYNFALCLDEFYSKQRGCQPPWHSHPSVRLPPCRNLTEMRSWFDHFGRGWDDYERASFSPLEAMHKTGCPLPCTSTTFTPKYSYEYLSRKEWLAPADLGSEWVAHLWFENFLFTRETEFLVCDWTCLLGEVGGNLGFFLGGSVLGYVDLVLVLVKRRWRK